MVFTGYTEEEMRYAIKAINQYQRVPVTPYFRDDYQVRVEPSQGLKFDFTDVHHFKQQDVPHVSAQGAILNTQRDVGRIILLSSVVLFAGFAILLLASLNTVLYFGIVACVGIVAALIGELVILPLILTNRFITHSIKGDGPLGLIVVKRNRTRHCTGCVPTDC